MKAYILTVAGAALLSAVIAILIPGGRMGKFVKGMSRLLVLSIVVTPLIALFTKGEFAFPETDVALDEDYLFSCASMLEEEDEERAEKLLSEQFSLSCEARMERVLGDGFPRKKITVKITDPCIFGQDEHIDMTSKLKRALEEAFCCTAEVEWIRSD